MSDFWIGGFVSADLTNFRTMKPYCIVFRDPFASCGNDDFLFQIIQIAEYREL
jgi:hypothetical protein